MKKTFILLAIIASITACTSTQQEDKKEASESKPAIGVEQLATDIDPVCKMSVKNHMADTAAYNGKTYGFCNTACKEDFLKNPEQHLHE